MILVGNQRGGAADLAQHLMKDENERVEVHEMRGFASDNLMSAFQESYAISRATKCKQHLFSLSLNPPPDADVSVADFEDAIERVEDKLGLSGQPRAIVFHEKHGRRHAHAVWCRIDVDQMKAVQLSYTKNKLQEIARELYIAHDWQMPRGFVQKAERNQRNFTLQEWQQAKRAGKDAKAFKGKIQDCWAVSDSKTALAHALAEHGLVLAKGDRRGFVAVDHEGEVYSLSRWVGVKAKQVRAKLGKPEGLPDVERAHQQAAAMVTDRLEELQRAQERMAQEKQQRLQAQAERRREGQREAQQRLEARQAERARMEDVRRESRYRSGFLGMLGWFDRMTGRRKRTEEQNRAEVLQGLERDRREREIMLGRQMAANDALADQQTAVKARLKAVAGELQSDIERLSPVFCESGAAERNVDGYGAKDQDMHAKKREEFKAKRRKSSPPRSRNRDGPSVGR